MAEQPPFPSFANSAVAQIEIGFMDEHLDAVAEAVERRKTHLADAAYAAKDKP